MGISSLTNFRNIGMSARCLRREISLIPYNYYPVQLYQSILNEPSNKTKKIFKVHAAKKLICTKNIPLAFSISVNTFYVIVYVCIYVYVNVFIQRIIVNI